MKNMGAMMIREKAITRPLKSLSTIILLRTEPCFILSLHVHPDDDDPADDIDDGGHDEEYQGDLHEAREIYLAGGFGEFVGDDTCHSIRRSEDTFWKAVRIAYYHGDRHGFAEGPAEGEEHP